MEMTADGVSANVGVCEVNYKVNRYFSLIFMKNYVIWVSFLALFLI